MFTRCESQVLAWTLLRNETASLLLLLPAEFQRLRCTHSMLQVYGMVDQEQLSQPEELTKEQVLKSMAWVLAQAIVLKDWGNLNQETEAHFHNYDRMEVWGLL
jgi:hypothetical protein